ncbi:hypothetical protein [Rahnella perminowiae]|uniref:hypothetical protein n=1 Tax=Rahnella perminowiae TaxID=2816244 RepID=UPI00215BCFD2|nr:hypothetical protein [Rahnella perminowiae]MCR8998657.1 hypothetical protein [Rahnella perminowiae]MCR8998715.1 hypothetical protein [Rahnella perminowiae]
MVNSTEFVSLIQRLSINEIKGMVRTANAIYRNVNLGHLSLSSARKHIESAGRNDALALGLTVKSEGGMYYTHDFFHAPVREVVLGCFANSKQDTLLELNGLKSVCGEILKTRGYK